MADNTTNKSVSVGTTPVVIMSQLLPTQRKSYAIINTSTSSQKISISIDDSPANGKGVVLSPGGSWDDTASGESPSDYFPTFLQFIAVSDIAGGSLAIMERVGNQVRQ